MANDTEIRDEALGLSQAILKTINEYYADETATVGSLIGIFQAMRQVSKRFDDPVIDSSMSIIKLRLDDMAQSYINE